MLKLSVVNGVKDAQGNYAAPTDIDPTKVIQGTDAEHVSITGLQSGDTVVAGEYFYGEFNDVENKFVSDLKPVPEFTVLGNATVGDAKVAPTSNGADLSTGE